MNLHVKTLVNLNNNLIFIKSYATPKKFNHSLGNFLSVQLHGEDNEDLKRNKYEEELVFIENYFV